MGIFDVILLFILFGFLYGGLFNGLIKSLGAILSIIIGASFASFFYLKLFVVIGGFFGPFENIGKSVCFILMFLLIGAVVGIAVKIVDRAYNLISFIPFLKTINRFAGAILGLFEGVLVLGLILYIFAKYFKVSSSVGGLLINSEIAPILIKISKIFIPFLSNVLKSIASIV